MISEKLVLVTGGSGFIGVHCILKLLAGGYHLRATLRDLRREPEVRQMLKTAGVDDTGNQLQFVQADLNQDQGWAEAVAHCTHVLHIASPFPSWRPRDPDELIQPARQGSLRVLRAARDAGVGRVVLTSSFAAIGYGQAADKILSESDWTDPKGPFSAYVKSKTLAEQAAWEFMEREGQGLELAVINPVAVFGPVLGPDYAASILLIKLLLEGRLPVLPQLSFGVVDVRDLADLHLRAMVYPQARGERFLASAGDALTLQQIARLLKAELGEQASRVSTCQLPNWLVRLGAVFSPALAEQLSELGKVKRISHDKAHELLGWQPRSSQEALLATAESLIRLKLLR